MDKNNIEAIKVALIEINKLVAQLDPSIRAAAFEILRPHYFGQKQARIKVDEESGEQEDTSADQKAPSELADFISSYDHKKPKDNVMLLAAWLYSMYGVYSITAKEIKDLGDSCGLIMPGRPGIR